ncbi:MAG TPA: NADH-ubiquinone oxidoreductase-F iron-sulfur binding region domain-containing protein [Acidimicrobiales bacterium]
MTSVTDYVEQRGGGRGLARARALGPGGTIQEVALSGLRGRGGAGFPTGRKWRSIRDGAGAGVPRYVVANGAEGEPGTWKDRAILRSDPYQVVEGVAIAALAVGAERAYLAVKERFVDERDALARALAEMAAAGLAGDVPIDLVAGPQAYLFGEETGLLEVIEGNAALPRLYPPYQHGLFATAAGTPNPTLVNNVETLAMAAHVLANGPEWHRSAGTEESPGIVVCTVSGDVVAPAVAEVALGTPLGQVIDEVGGGVAPGRSVKAVLSGVSNPVLRGDQLDVPVSYEGMAAAGTGLGSCGFVAFDDTASMVEVAVLASRFLADESCGQCPPCKLGTAAITGLLERVAAGAADEATFEQLHRWLVQVTDGNRCYLPVEEQRLVSSLLQTFPEDFVVGLEGRPVPWRGLTWPDLA